jgi:TolA-binding protein
VKIVDLHPEELLDKDARAELTDSERTRLDAHCAQCAACRAERQLRLDFAEERSEDGIEEAQFSSELIAIALGSAKAKKPVDVEENAPAPSPRAPSIRPAARPRRIARVWLLAAAAFLGVTAAAAHQAQHGSWVRRVAGIDAPSALETNAPSMKTPAAPVVAHAPAAAKTVLAAPAPEPTVDDAPALPPEPVPAAVVPIVPVVAPAPAPVKAITAATMFDDANEARRKGDYARAIDLHRQLQTRHPSSREAQVSRATLGRLLLDRGDLASALASFDDYLARGHGELDEAVMVGRATALDRLGRTTESRRAWQALLDSFPSSPYAEHARSRTESRD